jgi:hypothetical protein
VGSLKLNNDYNCGVLAVLEALIHAELPYDASDLAGIEYDLKTDKVYGTEEREMLKLLRQHFTVLTRKTHDADFLTRWLAAGHQAIVLYPWRFNTKDYHYSNIFSINNHDTHYQGANFWLRSKFVARIRQVELLELMTKAGDNIRRIFYIKRR